MYLKKKKNQTQNLGITTADLSGRISQKWYNIVVVVSFQEWPQRPNFK